MYIIHKQNITVSSSDSFRILFLRFVVSGAFLECITTHYLAHYHVFYQKMELCTIFNKYYFQPIIRNVIALKQQIMYPSNWKEKPLEVLKRVKTILSPIGDKLARSIR